MRRILACSVMIVAVAGGLRIPGLPPWALILGIAAVGALAWRLSVCPHDGPLALLPATTDIEGTPLPPRWFCDACGRTWAANFDKAQTPVAKFTGYDESKAVNAAKRAAELAERQRMLALQRAGLRPATATARRAARPAPEPNRVPDTADVVPIGHGRRFAG
jgi:hypothetical protein